MYWSCRKPKETTEGFLTCGIVPCLQAAVFLAKSCKRRQRVKVKAPKGYHWMKDGKEYKLMKNPTGDTSRTKALLNQQTLKFKKFISQSKETVMHTMVE